MAVWKHRRLGFSVFASIGRAKSLSRSSLKWLKNSASEAEASREALFLQRKCAIGRRKMRKLQLNKKKAGRLP